MRMLRKVDPKNAREYNYTNTLRDVANACPSPSVEALDKMIEDATGGGKAARVLKHSYRESRMKITNKQGGGVVM